MSGPLRLDRPSVWLPLAVLAAAALAAGKPPVVDEESYLQLAAQISAHPLRPYDWWRRWQPWGAAPVADAFVYAHPPLHLWWVALCRAVAPAGPALRLLATAPWALLLGWSAGRLAERYLSRPAAGAALWLATPIAVVAAQSGLMIDLGASALGTAGMALWLTRAGPTGALMAGGLLGLAGLYKYPALVLLGAVAWDTWQRARWRDAALATASFAAIWGAVEIWLAAIYGRFHLGYVLANALEIGRGPLGGRAVGVLLRLGLLVSPVLLAGLPAGLCLGAAAGAVAGAAGTWSAVDGPGGHLLAGLLGGSGGAGLAAALAGLRRGGEEGVIGLWVLLVLGGVVAGHNYAAARYLLPAALPLALLLARALERGRRRWVAPAGAASWGVLALALGYAEQRQARATAALAEQVARLYVQEPERRFTGEWTLRWALTEAGWTCWVPGEPLAPGALLAAPRHASPAPLPAGLERIAIYESPDHFPLRLVDLEAGIGYHAETLGALPFGWRDAPLEVLTLYRVPE